MSASRSSEYASQTSNLPVQLTPFLGRDAEVSAVAELLRRDEVRLLTLTGPGGTGKTRLALETASRLGEEFPGGVYFVELASVSDPALLVSKAAYALGVEEAAAATPAEGLINFLRDRKALLTLDNFEQIVAAAPVVIVLLEECPRLKILVTSRTALNLTGEQEFPVPSMRLPDVERLPPAHDLTKFEAVALYVQRALAVKPDFKLTGENAPAVAQICARLDGLPLAIELAAARVKLLSPQAMLKRLESPLQLLTGGAQDKPSRQQTMRGAIEWSYELLDEAEKRLFRRMTVFAGGAAPDALEEVCNSSDDLGADVQDALTSLLNKSLVRQVEQPNGEPRFQMLETIRAYGRERLAESPEEETVQLLHASFFIKLAGHAAPELHDSRQAAWLERLEQEHANILLALAWLVEKRQGETALRLVSYLWWFWYVRGHYHEGREWLGRVLYASSGSRSTLRARALHGAGVLAFLQCDYVAADVLLKKGLALARELEDREAAASCLQVLGSVARERGDYARAVSRHSEALAMWRQFPDKRGIARSLNYVGFAAWLNREFEQAEKTSEVALTLYAEVGDKEGLVWSHLNLGAAAHYRGRAQSATSHCTEALSLSREIGFKEGVAWSLDILGNVARLQGHGAQAAGMLRESLQLHQQLGDRWRVSSVLESLAAAAAGEGEFARAARLFGAADSLRESIGTPLPPAELPAYEQAVNAARYALGEETFARYQKEGRDMTIQQAVAHALDAKTLE